MMETTRTAGTATWHGVRMVLVAAVAGAGIGIGGISLLGGSNDGVTLQAASTPSQEAGSNAAAEATADRAGSLPESTAPTTEPGLSADGSDRGGEIVDRATAEQAALAYLGEGRVTWASQEDDHGAAWEIEVTLPSGREVDVYVDAAGRVVNTS